MRSRASAARVARFGASQRRTSEHWSWLGRREHQANGSWTFLRCDDGTISGELKMLGERWSRQTRADAWRGCFDQPVLNHEWPSAHTCPPLQISFPSEGSLADQDAGISFRFARRAISFHRPTGICSSAGGLLTLNAAQRAHEAMARATALAKPKVKLPSDDRGDHAPGA